MEKSLLQRFEEKYVPEPNSGCWLWTAYVNRFGYGTMRVAGKSIGAHRISYEMFKGPIPEGMQTDHLCRVRCCVNPDHLEAVSPRENTVRGNRPEMFAAWQREKTHCPHGHEYTADNVYRNPNGARKCRTCHLFRTNARKRKLKQK